MVSNREKLEQKFRGEFSKLNKEQQLAVNNIEGPVMVIAGPGTGKTQILASRIGKILLETDALPENVLCLTYTEAGVVAMRKRLLEFIGPDAYKVNIYTFHAFCNDVIQENLGYFEKSVLDPVSELEQIEMMKELVDRLPKKSPLKRYRGDVYYEVKHLLKLFSSMKREGWSPEFIHQKIDEYLEDLPKRKEYIYQKKTEKHKAGDLKQDKIDEEKERMEKLKAAVNEFDHYQELMRNRNRYDFDDMINWVLRAFQENKNLLANYQEQYQYILVDEYQDTSGTQNRLVELLISYWNKPNIFVVGDDDQSIFRFQGANVENMLGFADQYQKDLVTVVLTNNYRSTQPILDVSKTLISRNTERLVTQIKGLSKDLQAAHPERIELRHPPRIREYESQKQEMIDITLQVQKLVFQGVPPGRIAIIYRENRYGEELSAYLKQRGIPVYSKRSLNLLQHPMVRNIVLLLNYLAAEHDTPYGGDEMLFEILHADWFGIPPIEIAKLSVEAAEQKYSEKGSSSLRQLLADKISQPPRDLFTVPVRESMKMAGLVLEKLIAAVPNLTLQSLFEKIIREAGILSFIMKQPDKFARMDAISGIFDFIKEETRRNPMLTLQQLVNILGIMEKESIVLPLIEITGHESGVNLLTAHGSKGLEFEYVFLAGCNAGYWEKKRKPSGGFKLPDTLFAISGNRREEEELRRLFYVAITRAEQHLVISYSRYKSDGKEIEPSLFLAEIQDLHQFPVERIVLETGVVAEFAMGVFGEEMAPEIEKMEEDFIGPLIDRFVMNVTALNNYLHCPLEFYFRNLARIPSPKNEATEFGSAVHDALEKLFRKMLDSGTGTFPSRDVFIADFETYMHRHRESFTKEQFERRREYGHTILTAYYDENISRFSRIVAIERFIGPVVVEGVPLKGKLDKLEFDGKSVNIVDYKTGDPDKAIEKLKGPSVKEPLGGDYWRQAVFYKLLVDHYRQKDWKVVSTEFDFVEPGRKFKDRRKKLLITPEDIRIVTGQITEVWNKIRQRDFYTGCGREDCHWCEFVKTNKLAVAWHETGAEEEYPA